MYTSLPSSLLLPLFVLFLSFCALCGLAAAAAVHQGYPHQALIQAIDLNYMYTDPSPIACMKYLRVVIRPVSYIDVCH
jgi:hypothetical protein